MPPVKNDGKGVFPIVITLTWKAQHPKRRNRLPESKAVPHDVHLRQLALIALYYPPPPDASGYQEKPRPGGHARSALCGHSSEGV